MRQFIIVLAAILLAGTSACGGAVASRLMEGWPKSSSAGGISFVLLSTSPGERFFNQAGDNSPAGGSSSNDTGPAAIVAPKDTPPATSGGPPIITFPAPDDALPFPDRIPSNGGFSPPFYSPPAAEAPIPVPNASPTIGGSSPPIENKPITSVPTPSGGGAPGAGGSTSTSPPLESSISPSPSPSPTPTPTSGGGHKSVSEPVQGTVIIRLTNGSGVLVSSVVASVTGANMAPGDTATGFLEVSNAGSLRQRYAVTADDTSSPGSANTALASTLTVGIDFRAAGTACSPTQGGSGQTTVKSAGTILQTLTIGNPKAGSDIGDRTLNPGASERLCFYITLPLNAGNSTQGGSASYTFNFVAEQTANNP